MWTKDCCLWNSLNHGKGWDHNNNIIKKTTKEIDILVDYCKTGLPAIGRLLSVLQTSQLRRVGQLRNWYRYVYFWFCDYALITLQWIFSLADRYIFLFTYFLAIHIFNNRFAVKLSTYRHIPCLVKPTQLKRKLEVVIVFPTVTNFVGFHFTCGLDWQTTDHTKQTSGRQTIRITFELT